MLTVPPGHWREKELLAAQGFPTRKCGEPYVVVVHKDGRGAFVLDGIYDLLVDQLTDDDETVRLARLHHAETWDGWLPSKPSQIPWWASQSAAEDFIAYWVSE
jgi:hypothetical protein